MCSHSSLLSSVCSGLLLWLGLAASAAALPPPAPPRPARIQPLKYCEAHADSDGWRTGHHRHSIISHCCSCCCQPPASLPSN